MSLVATTNNPRNSILVPYDRRKSQGSRNIITAVNIASNGNPSNNSGRKSSVGFRRRSSLVDHKSTGAAGGGRPDPRNIKDKTFQTQCIHALVQFLLEQGYNQSISPKILTAPSSKDFFLIFQFLINQLDANFQYIQQKPEEDCPAIFKTLKYPVAVSKRSLLSVGSPHTWPALLAALAWLVELLNYYKKWVELRESEEEDDAKIFFQYLTNAYKSFLAGEDSFTILEQDLEQKYAQRNKALMEETRQFEERAQRCRDEVQCLKNAPTRLATLQQKKQILDRDSEKFAQLISTLESHKQQQEKKLQQARQILASAEAELETALKEKAALEKKLQQQEMNHVDVERIKQEIAQLDESLRTVQKQQEELKRDIWTKEIAVTKAFEEADQKVKEYNSKAISLSLIPNTTKQANGVDFSLKFQPHDPERMLSKPVKSEIKPKLKAYLNTLRTNLEATMKQELDLSDKRDKLQDEYSEKCTLNKDIQNKLASLDVLYNTKKEKSEEEMRQAESEIQTIVNETNNMKASIQEAIKQSNAQLEHTQKQLESLKQKFAQEISEQKASIGFAMEMLATHKNYVEERLRNFHLYLQQQWSGLQISN